MATTEIFYNGDDSTTLFTFPFEYITKDDVKVSINDVDTSEYTYANDTTIQMNSAPTGGQRLRIYRLTNVDDLKATFASGSSIRAQDLNNNFQQNNFAVEELRNYYWDNEIATIHSDETWVSSDTQIATTKAMDQRFLDEADEVILSSETWASNDDSVASTASIDNRIDSKIDTAIEGDILIDATGLTKVAAGGQVTLGIGANSVDLDRIKNSDVVTSSEGWPNDDETIATTAKIDDMIDSAIEGDILIDGTGLTKTSSGGQTTLGIGSGAVDFDRINPADIITQAEQNAGAAETDTSIFTSLAAARRFDTLVQTATPTGSQWEVGKTWLQNDDDLTLSIWNGGAWTAITSGGTFTEQPSVVYVDQASGDDNNTGHRISTPKASIKAAIEQINEDIDIDLTSGGSGYVEGTYNTVSLTGGTGTGLTADITVNATGNVSAVTLNSRTPLIDSYYIGDVLSADAADLGGSGSGLEITVEGDGDGQIVVVSAGVYQEIAPIQIKRRNVSIIGQALRSCIVHPTQATETNNLFELNSGSYLSSMTFTGVKAGTGTGNTLDATLPTTQGWNAAFYNNAFITKSPYIQNCTNFSDSEINNNALNAHNPAGGAAGDIDSAPTGGGLLINGATPHDDSPLRSMVCDSYTHVALNGPGILVTNNGYAQCTSSYAFFNRYHIKCLNGGQANLAASTTDFGTQALVADGKSTTNIFTANCVTAVDTSGAAVTTIRVSNGNADASWHGSTTRPQSNMLLAVNSEAQIYPILQSVPQDQATFDADPAGYTGDWIVTISRPDPTNRSNNLGFSANVATGTDNVQFFLRSQIASSGHTMEYVGSGTNYTALPENGGVPIEANQVVESNNGKIWTATTDHNGKFKVGDFFEVDQQLGFVTIPEGSIAFDVLSDTTPQLGGDLDVNGQSIVSTSNGDINITPNGTGAILLNTTTAVDGALGVSGDTLLGGQIFLENGTATDPTLAWGGTNQDTGIYSPGEDQLAITTNGTARLSIDSTGLISANSNRISSVADPSLAQDAATKNYIDTNFVDQTASNGAANIPSGADGDRPGTPAAGQFRFNTTSTEFEGYDGTAWGNIGGGTAYPEMGVSGTNRWAVVHSYTVDDDYSIPSGSHVINAGPMVINSGVTVTVPTGSNWVIV